MAAKVQYFILKHIWASQIIGSIVGSSIGAGIVVLVIL
jgi:hypothetical protein